MAKDKDKKIKVAVAMSGGVDSSLAAAILKKQGFDVVGVFMRFWKEGSKSNCAIGSEKAAKAVARKLKIPFLVFDLSKEFKKEVVDYFLSEQSAGRTPNPCVVCNRKIKFGAMLKRAIKEGFDLIATGHYARIEKIKNQKSKIKAVDENSKLNFKLFKAKDKDKDQSYFLYQLKQKELSRVLFPVGDYEKRKVVSQAKKWRLPCQKEQSFDLCFVKGTPESFLRRHIKAKPGQIKDLSGKILGQHEGLPFFTVGQRKNILLANGPWWVVKKDENNNILYVSNKENDLYGKTLLAQNINWISGKSPKMPFGAKVKIRYRSDPAEAIIKSSGRNKLELSFNKSQRAITLGQSAVFYKNDELLGGGVIN